MRQARFLVFCLLFAAITTAVHAQATGLYAFGPFDSRGFDTINRGNLNIHFSIPIVSKPGRGGSNFAYALTYDGLIWSPKSSSGANVWTPVPAWGWGDATNAEWGYVTYEEQLLKCTLPPKGLQEVEGVYSHYVYHDNKGNSHSIPFSLTDPCGNTSGPTGTGTYTLTDNSGLVIYRQNNSFTVFNKQGAEYGVPVYTEFTGYNEQTHVGSGTFTDTNGNEISASSSGAFTDTMGKTVLTLAGAAPNPVAYTYTDSNGVSQTVTVNYSEYTVQTNFGVSGITEYSQSNIPLVSSIVFSADNSSYTFTYEATPGNSSDVTGRIASITLRTGGTISYVYTGGNNGVEADGTTAGLNRTTTDGTMTYARSAVTSTTSTTTITDATGNQSVSTFLINPTGGYFYENDRKDYQGSASGTPLQEIQTCYNSGTCNSSVTSAFTSVNISTYRNGTLVNIDDQTYAGPELLQGDYQMATSITTSYNYNEYSGPFGIPFYRLTSKVASSGSSTVAETTYAYDETTPQATSGLPQHASVSTTRGNLTSIHQWYNSSGSTLNTTMAYDDAGQVLSKTDTNGDVTSYAYDTTTDTLLTKVTLPSVNGNQFSGSYNFDPNTGLLLSSTDINNQTTSYSYDGMLRPTHVSFPDGGKATYGYTATQTSVYQYQNASTYSDSEILVDGYGRTSRVAIANGQGSNPWYQKDICYNAVGEIGFRSYSYQGTGFAQGKVCSGNGDVYSYDGLGRVLQLTHSDSKFVSYVYNGTATEVTDENGVQRIINAVVSGTNAPETTVCEISANTLEGDSPTSCNMPINGTGFLTTYKPVPGSNEITVTQGIQTRTFQTDWAGRPILVQEPESGQTTYSYAYNSTGLQVTRTRPQANQTGSSQTTTTYQYDALNRLVSVTYTDGTAPKYFEYDSGPTWGASPAPTNQKGRLAWYGNASGGGTVQGILGYDPMGRVNVMDQCDPSNCVTGNYATAYTYDWTGNLLTLSDGQGVSDTYAYSPASELASITSSVNNPTHPPNIVSNVQYGPDGPLSWQLGNGLDGVRAYDSMGRNTGGWVCSGTTQQFCTGGSQTYGYTVGWSGGRPNSACDTVLNRCSSFGYDEFNRIDSQTVTQGAADNFTYVYDRYGNRWQQNVTAGSGPGPSFSFNKSTNQIVDSPCPSTAHICYDAAGNLMSDGSHSYTYDADGNVTAVDGGSTAKYTYNALNERVRSDLGSSSSEEFIFDSFGRHTSARDVIHNWAWSDWIYWGSSNARVAVDTDSQTNFDHQDWEGTERAMTLYNGQTVGTYTSLPFGDGYSVSGSDIDSLHFAMLDRDSSSDTDHAQFRQYGNTQGRWMSPDPYSGSYDFNDPQSMNRYSYAMNSPMEFTDPQGLEISDCLWTGGCNYTGPGSPTYGGGGGEPGDYGANGGTGWISQQQQWMGLFGTSYFDLPGGSGFGMNGALTQELYLGQWWIDWTSPQASPGETIYVHCTGDDELIELTCSPYPNSMRYFSPGQYAYYSDPLMALAVRINSEAGWIGTPKGVAEFYGASFIGAGLADSAVLSYATNDFLLQTVNAGESYGIPFVSNQSVANIFFQNSMGMRGWVGVGLSVAGRSYHNYQQGQPFYCFWCQ